MIERRTVLKLLAAQALWPAAAVSADDAAAFEPPILTLRGAFRRAGPDGTLALTLADFDAMPQATFTTKTPWHADRTTFSGVPVAALLAVCGVEAATLRLFALNDYVVDANVAELEAADGLVATRQDGRPMPVSDKGPLFVVFPFDARPELRHQNLYSRCVWQLCAIGIV